MSPIESVVQSLLPAPRGKRSAFQPFSRAWHSKVLALEHDPVIAGIVEDAVETIGAFVSATDIHDAMRLVECERFVAAVLDVNVNGHLTFGVADALRRRGVPVIFLTSYHRFAMPRAYAGVPCVEKPFTAMRLRDVLEEAIAATAVEV